MVHLIDLAAPTPRLLETVRGESEVIALSLETLPLRWRARRMLNGRHPETIVAWSFDALRVARRCNAPVIHYRPLPDVLTPPMHGVVAVMGVCHGETQRRRFARAGWNADDLIVMRDPVPTRKAIDRESIGATAEDFLWLLPADATLLAGRAAGLRLAIWAGALLHVLERKRPWRHRLVIPGDGVPQRVARRFMDQLGLPDLGLPVTTADAVDVATVADAVLLTPVGPCDPWPASLAKASGLPVVTTDRPEMLEILTGTPRVLVTPWRRPRLISQEMLKLTGLSRAASEPSEGADSSGQSATSLRSGAA